jgi:hypothetical protein
VLGVGFQANIHSNRSLCEFQPESAKCQDFTLGADEEIYEIAGRTCDMGLEKIGEFGCMWQVLQQNL